MENIFELKEGTAYEKGMAKQLEKIYVCPSSEVDCGTHQDCIIWKTMDRGCEHCPFRTFDL